MGETKGGAGPLRGGAGAVEAGSRRWGRLAGGWSPPRPQSVRLVHSADRETEAQRAGSPAVPVTESRSLVHLLFIQQTFRSTSALA